MYVLIWEPVIPLAQRHVLFLEEFYLSIKMVFCSLLSEMKMCWEATIGSWQAFIFSRLILNTYVAYSSSTAENRQISRFTFEGAAPLQHCSSCALNNGTWWYFFCATPTCQTLLRTQTSNFISEVCGGVLLTSRRLWYWKDFETATSHPFFSTAHDPTCHEGIPCCVTQYWKLCTLRLVETGRSTPATLKIDLS